MARDVKKLKYLNYQKFGHYTNKWPKKIKQTLLFATSNWMIDARAEDVIVLDKMLCIYYLGLIKKERKEVAKVFIDIGSKENAMTLASPK